MSTPRVLEAFCGIGGAAVALGARAQVALAVDVNVGAIAIYRRNLPHPTAVRLIESIAPDELAALRADLWWMSPPCQPYTSRGRRADAADPRTRALAHLTAALAQVRPSHVALENVPGFAGSHGHAALRDALDQAGYQVRECVLCPTELGVPNRRRRYYLVASREPLQPWPDTQSLPTQAVADWIDADIDWAADPGLFLTDALRQRYAFALDRVDPSHAGDRLACFTSAYGRSVVKSGSYLATPQGLRRLAPREILRALGFPRSFTLPPDLPPRKAWPLLGNSLSVPVVRHVLRAFPALAPCSIGG